MDIGKAIDDLSYYEGYEGEPEITIHLGDVLAVHIWEGFFDDIFDTPSLDGSGWTGFTRDCQQFEGAFSDDCPAEPVRIDPEEYLEDILQYKEKAFHFEETASVFVIVVEILRKAINENLPVTVKVF